MLKTETYQTNVEIKLLSLVDLRDVFLRLQDDSPQYDLEEGVRLKAFNLAVSVTTYKLEGNQRIEEKRKTFTIQDPEIWVEDENNRYQVLF